MAGGNEVSVAVGAGNTVTIAVAGATGTTPTITNGGTANVTVTSVGDRGPQGDLGPATTLSIGTVTGGETAAATLTGPSGAQVLSLVLPKGDAGTPATNVELQATATHIQWRYVGGTSWTNLVALSAITGPAGANGTNGTNGANGTNGSSVELQTTATHIQWRLVGGSTWTNLVALSAITGPAGPGGGVSWSSVPLSPASGGTLGDIAYDNSFFYVKSAAGWRRAPLAAWTPLSAPLGIYAIAGDADATVYWTAPESDGGYAITDYAVQFSSTGGATWSTFSDGNGSDTQALVTGLANGSAYVFRVAAVNSAGTGPWSAASDSATPSGASNFDPYFSSVSLLLHMDGANGSTSFTDSSPNAIAGTASGNAQISTAQSAFAGGSSGYFDGGAATRVAFANSWPQDFSFDADFTVEAWIYPTSIAGTKEIVTRYNGSSDSWSLRLEGGKLAWFGGAATSIYYEEGSVSLNQWQHVAVSRIGNSTRLFIGGAQAGTTKTTSFPVQIQEGTVGCMVGGTNMTGYESPFSGYIEEVRVTKGVGRYASNFTPPTAPFPDA